MQTLTKAKVVTIKDLKLYVAFFAGSSKNVELWCKGLIKGYEKNVKTLLWSVQKMWCWVENDTLHFVEEFEKA